MPLLPSRPTENGSTLVHAAASSVDLVQVAVGIHAGRRELHVEPVIDFVVLVRTPRHAKGMGLCSEPRATLHIVIIICGTRSRNAVERQRVDLGSPQSRNTLSKLINRCRTWLEHTCNHHREPAKKSTETAVRVIEAAQSHPTPNERKQDDRVKQSISKSLAIQISFSSPTLPPCPPPPGTNANRKNHAQTTHQKYQVATR